MPWHSRLAARTVRLAEQIAPGRTALVLVDMQNDFVHDEGIFVKQWGKTNRWIKEIIPTCSALLQSARATNVPVIHLRILNDLLRNPESWHNFWGPPSCVIDGTWGAEFVAPLRPRDDEIVISRHTYDGFVGTPLDALLRRLNVKTLVFGGIDSDVCVRDTVGHGFALGYTPVLARDALACDNEVAQAGVLQTLGEHYGLVVSTSEILAVWQP